ncbi:hypothetical protein J3E74DRAFT_224471 [Bipolaris maydis]|nr:hypothetical protein J3E74DRAFT_224471 [Bipolaris maydis]
MEKNTKTVLIIGATSNIGVAAILDALGSDRNFLAVVRDQHSIKVLEHVPTGYDRITVVESDAVSDQGVQNIVAKVRAGSNFYKLFKTTMSLSCRLSLIILFRCLLCYSPLSPQAKGSPVNLDNLHWFAR